jgi:hypothetical protein
MSAAATESERQQPQQHASTSVMGTMIVRHRAPDFDARTGVSEAHGRVRRRYGSQRGSRHRDADDPRIVTVVLKAEDLAPARELAGTADLKQTVRRAGVISESEIWFTNDA